MFVINADNNGGVNGSYATMNAYLDTSLDGEYYTLFPSGGVGMIYACCICWPYPNTNPQVPGLQYWDGNNDSACSYYNEYKANDIDHTIIYPFHYTGLCSFAGSADCHYNFCGWANFCYGVIAYAQNCAVNAQRNYCAMTCLDNLLFYRFVGQKEFSGGEIIGKSIKGFLTACVNNNFTSKVLGNSNCCLKLINTCPFNLIINIGLIHTDGTQSCLINCYIPFPYGCIANASNSCGGTRCYSDNICPDATTYRNNCRLIDILNGRTDTDGIEAEEGDRIFIEYKTVGCVKPQFVFNTTAYGSGSFANNAFMIYSNNVYTKFCNCTVPANLCNYTYYPNSRYEGISFSIE